MVLLRYTLLLIGAARTCHRTVGDPMFFNDVPLLYGMLVVVVVIAMERVLAFLASRNTSIEEFIETAGDLWLLQTRVL